ncbi:MAG: peptidase M15A [Leptolyngbyaceae cyanobacterium]
MAKLSSSQRDAYYCLEAIRTGIHKPILAALASTHKAPPLEDGETGLGIAPANRIPPAQVNTLPEQIRYAANTLRSLTDHLIAEGWQGKDLWNVRSGRYRDRFLKRVAEGYSPPASDSLAARLEPSEIATLTQLYRAEATASPIESADLESADFTGLDAALVAFAKQVTTHYQRLRYQQQALLEAARLWRKLDTHGAVMTAFKLSDGTDVVDEAALDKALLTFIQQVDRYFLGYPNQREALLRLVQLWQQQASRQVTFQGLLNDPEPTAATPLVHLDPVLIAFVQSLAQTYQGKGHQRFALTETYRLWQGLDSRTAAIQDLGIDPQVLLDNTDDPDCLAQQAVQIDRALMVFLETVSITYNGSESHREALIRLVQTWQQLDGRSQTLNFLFDGLRRMERAHRGAVDAMPPPQVQVLPRRPTHWTPDNLQLDATVVAGSFTWAEATQGGLFMPTHQATVDAITRTAPLVHEARDRIGRPFYITRWYEPSSPSPIAPNSSHDLGTAIDFYCPGLTGRQLYWALDPWWPRGLEHNTRYAHLCHLEASGDRARVLH